MTDLNIRTALQSRKNQRQQKMARFAKHNTPEMVHVVPRNESARRMLAHPNGTKFRESGGRDWPLDQFTKRRLREGAITIEKKEEQQSRQASAPQQNHRQAPAPAPAKQSE